VDVEYTRWTRGRRKWTVMLCEEEDYTQTLDKSEREELHVFSLRRAASRVEKWHRLCESFYASSSFACSHVSKSDNETRLESTRYEQLTRFALDARTQEIERATIVLTRHIRSGIILIRALKLRSEQSPRDYLTAPTAIKGNVLCE